MNSKELKEYSERNKEYREESMIEIMDALIRRADFFKMDLLKNKKRLEEKEDKNNSSKGEIFNIVKANVRSYTQSFNIERLEDISRNWESLNQVLKALRLLEEKQD